MWRAMIHIRRNLADDPRAIKASLQLIQRVQERESDPTLLPRARVRDRIDLCGAALDSYFLGAKSAAASRMRDLREREDSQVREALRLFLARNGLCAH